MSRLLRNLDFTWLSFFLGFLAGGLFWWLLGKLRPRFGQVRKSVSIQAQSTRHERVSIDEVRLGNEVMRFTQGLHLAAPLFSLDEVTIPARLLPPPQEPIYHKDVLPAVDITDSTIPYLPEWPQFASFYNAPTMTLAHALHGDAHLVVIGAPGSGKTVALAQLATQAVKQDPALGDLAQATPLLVRAADLLLPAGAPEELFTPLVSALSVFVDPKLAARLPKLVTTIFQAHQVLLIVDGLDELPPNEFDQVVYYLGNLLNGSPNIRVVVSASPDYLGGLFALDFVPMVLADWNREQRDEFLTRWRIQWTEQIAPIAEAGSAAAGVSGEQQPDPMLVHGWLLNSSSLLTPLELTLKAWAAYAGDTLGPKPLDAVEAHVRRMTLSQPPKNRPAFAQMCAQMVLTMQPCASQRNANQWLSGGGAEVPLEAMEAVTNETVSETKEKVRAPGALTDLIESGLVREHPGERVSVAHPVLTGYLASQALANTQAAEQLLTQPDWTGQKLTLQYLAAQDVRASWIDPLLVDEQSDPLLHGLFKAASWLKEAPEKAIWASNLMRTLAASLQKDTIPTGLKARMISALVNSGNPGVVMLLRQMLASPQDELRQLAALGTGVLRDPKPIPDLGRLVADPSLAVSRAALLALVAIDEKQALEIVAYALLHGSERLRQDAAEALANHPEEGHPSLQEGSELEDHAVRRAVVFGLGRIGQPWAIEILDGLRTKDSQWIVKDAATQVVEELERPSPRLPHRLPALTHTAWLIEFAGKRGIGVAPGKPAYDLLYNALREGSEEQKLAALYFLCYHGDESSILPLYQTYFSSSGELREAALITLWHLAVTGVSLPPPAQYGLK